MRACVLDEQPSSLLRALDSSALACHRAERSRPNWNLVPRAGSKWRSSAFPGIAGRVGRPGVWLGERRAASRLEARKSLTGAVGHMELDRTSGDSRSKHHGNAPGALFRSRTKRARDHDEFSRRVDSSASRALCHQCPSSLLCKTQELGKFLRD